MNFAFIRSGGLLAAVSSCLLLCCPPVFCDEMPVPAPLQVPLILKILTYDRNFDVKATSELIIGIVYRSGDPSSLKAKNEISAVLEEYGAKTIRRLPIRYRILDFTAESALEQSARSERINVFYIAPGNQDILSSVLKISRSNRITTITGVPPYVEKGVAVGVGLKQEKPQILINLPSSKSEGSEFDAGLLRIATVLR